MRFLVCFKAFTWQGTTIFGQRKRIGSKIMVASLILLLKLSLTAFAGDQERALAGLEIISSQELGGIPCVHCTTSVCIGREKTTSIESLKPGDCVMGFNLELKELESHPVLRVYKTIVPELIRLSYGNVVIRTTVNFPYFTVNRGWTLSQALILGDQLLSLSGESIILESIERETGEFEVFNIEVDAIHSFYACNVLVHNSNIPINMALTGARAFLGLGNGDLAALAFNRENNAILGTPANVNEEQIVNDIRSRAQYESALREHGIDPKSVPPVSCLPGFATASVNDANASTGLAAKK